MGHAAVVSVVAGQVEEVSAALRGAVPEHWTGRAAHRYQQSATNLAAGLGMYGERIRGVARLVHRHEQEAAAVRAALAGGGMAAV
ncbi:hypothetical protein [Pseudactinotalea suaedae]|uniref:hypothetical protein n=1 Tax=Pseudactinotalea suaedae TaxID=1524924 RepID=UPI0012E0EB84|nr:hypothetical protein [Pseudactinotalea suaedae]